MDNKTLYCFKIDEQNATLTRYEIDDYEMLTFHKEYFFTFSANLGNKNSSKHDVPVAHLDKVCYMKIYTFDPDFSHALAIANADLINKRDNAYKEYSRLNELIIHMNKNYQNQ